MKVRKLSRDCRKSSPGTFFPIRLRKSDEPWVVVQLKAVQSLKKSVTLAGVKADPHLAEMALIKYSRLSVQPVTRAEWRIICKAGGVSGLGHFCEGADIFDRGNTICFQSFINAFGESGQHFADADFEYRSDALCSQI